MFRISRVIGTAVLCAVTAAVAVPTGVAGAIPFGDVKILYRGEELEVPDGRPEFGVEAEVGSTVTLTASSRFDEPVSYYWDVDRSGLGGGYVVDGPSVTVTCEGPGVIDIELTGYNDQDEDYDVGNVYCTVNQTTWLELGAPKNPKRRVIPLGATLRFESEPLTPDVPTSWRITGWTAPRQARRITKTFDQVGNFGVEVSAVTASGPVKTWVGYTVVAPPTAAVSPAPAGRLKVALGSTVTFDGSGSRSRGGGSLTYEWRTTGVPDVAGDKVSFPRRFDRVGNVGVELIVTDELGQRAKQRVEVTVFKPEAPVVSVTPAPANPKDRMMVTLGSTVAFDGRASRDPDGGVLTYQWRTTGVSGLAGTAGTFRRKFTKAGNYGVELTVIDDEGQRAKRWVGVTVR